jgi:hypothetical protein
MVAMTPETYSWISVLVSPLSTLLIGAIFLYGALTSRFRLAFGLIACGGMFFLISHTYWLVLQIQHSFGLALLSREGARILFPIQAIIHYFGLAVVITGDALLVWQVSTTEPRKPSNQAMQRTAPRSDA